MMVPAIMAVVKISPITILMRTLIDEDEDEDDDDDDQGKTRECGHHCGSHYYEKKNALNFWNFFCFVSMCSAVCMSNVDGARNWINMNSLRRRRKKGKTHFYSLFHNWRLWIEFFLWCNYQSCVVGMLIEIDFQVILVNVFLSVFYWITLRCMNQAKKM